jgi:hypothetical protein
LPLIMFVQGLTETSELHEIITFVQFNDTDQRNLDIERHTSL